MLNPASPQWKTRWPTCRGRGSKTLTSWTPKKPKPSKKRSSTRPPLHRLSPNSTSRSPNFPELVDLAKAVNDSGEDRKWTELRSLLLDDPLLQSDSGPRKLIIFTEHRDTLNYLTHQIRNVLGRADAVVTIHGGTRRDERRVIREAFTHDPDVRVPVATDAAGEGLNLQAAHLMINYDLPWNPNRIEQRFGRIHRIGQKQVCRLWNLVADETREGQVFTRLLTKMEAQRAAYGGRPSTSSAKRSKISRSASCSWKPSATATTQPGKPNSNAS